MKIFSLSSFPELQCIEIEISLNQKQNCLERLGGFAPWSPCSSLCFFFLCVFLLIAFFRTWKVFRCVFVYFFPDMEVFLFFGIYILQLVFSFTLLDFFVGVFPCKKGVLSPKKSVWKLLVGWLIEFSTPRNQQYKTNCIA